MADSAATEDFRTRVAEAQRLRRTCDTCGRGGLEPKVGARATLSANCADVPLWKNDSGAFYGDCPGSGHGIVQVALALGVSKSTAGLYLADPDRVKVKARRSLAFPCVDCGQGMDKRPGTKGNPNWRCHYCREGVPSPARRAASPTGFQVFEPRTECHCGCGGHKAPGHHVCQEMAERLAPVREELKREAKRHRRDPAHGIAWLTGVQDDEPRAVAA